MARPSQMTGSTRAVRERLFAVCDPATADRAAKQRQAEVIEENGGREAILARGDFGNSPPPGVMPTFLATAAA